jgi:hypothetical protein
MDSKTRYISLSDKHKPTKSINADNTYKKFKTDKQASNAHLGLFSVKNPSGITEEKSAPIHKKESSSSDGFQWERSKLPDPDIAKQFMNIKQFNNMFSLRVGGQSSLPKLSSTDTESNYIKSKNKM